MNKAFMAGYMEKEALLPQSWKNRFNRTNPATAKAMNRMGTAANTAMRYTAPAFTVAEGDRYMQQPPGSQMQQRPNTVGGYGRAGVEGALFGGLVGAPADLYRQKQQGALNQERMRSMMGNMTGQQRQQYLANRRAGAGNGTGYQGDPNMGMGDTTVPLSPSYFGQVRDAAKGLWGDIRGAATSHADAAINKGVNAVKQRYVDPIIAREKEKAKQEANQFIADKESELKKKYMPWVIGGGAAALGIPAMMAMYNGYRNRQQNQQMMQMMRMMQQQQMMRPNNYAMRL